ncbi:hypothetical protein SLEP1_g59679 [Rubroshorea leprosula]|uniref:Uncharacterized protein n=1 Tax=Rubroshorea leprosula TaxID=152421 RepID=A0AAV5MU60_9ROSI|nr:hypothetical protein SLEP1_g59679 [Rubroshorea leprosula]
MAHHLARFVSIGLHCCQMTSLELYQPVKSRQMEVAQDPNKKLKEEGRREEDEFASH